MDETIKLLRERSILCAHLPELVENLIGVVKNNSPDVQEPISKIEAVMRDLSKNEQKTQEFLTRVKASSLAEFLATQDKNIQRDVAEKLLQKAADAQRQLKAQAAQLDLLLKRGKEYVEFNLNILAHISASDTYGAEAKTSSQRTRRMFDANI